MCLSPCCGKRRQPPLNPYTFIILKNMSNKKLIGIDFSTQLTKRYLISAIRTKDSYVIQPEVLHKLSNKKIREYIDKTSDATILSIDSPLGWPRHMVSSLDNHFAGESIRSNSLRADYFRRSTDKLVIEICGKTPFSVGADKIAATAFDALCVVGDILDRFDLDYGFGTKKDCVIIESYPAVHLTALLGGDYSKGYKDKSGKNNRTKRGDIYKLLATHYDSKVDFGKISANQILENDDVFDSFLCLLSAIDYDLGNLLGAENLKAKHSQVDLSKETLRKEGYIWGFR